MFFYALKAALSKCSELLDVAFLISEHYKKERTGGKTSYADVLYSELGGRKLA